MRIRRVRDNLIVIVLIVVVCVAGAAAVLFARSHALASSLDRDDLMPHIELAQCASLEYVYDGEARSIYRADDRARIKRVADALADCKVGEQSSVATSDDTHTLRFVMKDDSTATVVIEGECLKVDGVRYRLEHTGALQRELANMRTDLDAA